MDHYNSPELLLGQKCVEAKGRTRSTLRLLGSTATATDRAAATAALEASTVLAREATSATTGTAAEVVTEARLRAELALLDLDLETVHRVRVGVDSGLESGRRLEVDKGAVLEVTR